LYAINLIFKLSRNYTCAADVPTVKSSRAGAWESNLPTGETLVALALAKLQLVLPLRSYGFTFLFPATYGFDFRFYQDIRLNKGTPAGCYSGSSKPHAPVLLVLSIASKP
jgi:hypothetical protein